jgi:uncharacterized membrane protein
MKKMTLTLIAKIIATFGAFGLALAVLGRIFAPVPITPEQWSMVAIGWLVCAVLILVGGLLVMFFEARQAVTN